jgi:inner membrane protein
MIFWHLGVTTLAVRYVYRDPAMDLRWVMVGALLPDLIDKPIGSVFLNTTFHAHRLFAHTVVFPVVLFAGILLFTRRGPLRKGLIGLVIGVLFHLLLDAVWVSPQAFLWPMFGWRFPATDPSALGPLVAEMLTDPLVWAGEAAGAAYLVWLWATRLRPAGGLRRFLQTGTIPLATG